MYYIGNAGYLRYIDHMGGDLRVVNAARASFKKEATFFGSSEEGLLNYLAREGHLSPFRHVSITFEVKAPLLVKAQWDKHRIGVEINSASGRYVVWNENDYWIPDQWRTQDPDKGVKQGSTGILTDPERIAYLEKRWQEVMGVCFDFYHEMLDNTHHDPIERGIARGILPTALYTQFYCTFSMQALFNFWDLRTKVDAKNNAQREIRQYATALDMVAGLLFPVSWAALKEHRSGTYDRDTTMEWTYVPDDIQE